MFAVPFSTPACTLYASRLHSPIPGTALFTAALAFDEPTAKVMRKEMREFLRRAFGPIVGARAEVPLFEIGGQRWVLDLYSKTVPPTLCDTTGYPCVASRLPSGSRVRVSGRYEAMRSPRLAPMMQAMQIVELAADDGRLFEPCEAAA